MENGDGTLATAAIRFEGGGVFDWTGGTLHVDVFHADLNNRGGILAPGRPAEGNTITTIVGDYTQQFEAVLQIEIGGLLVGSLVDFVNITGNASLGGELHLALSDGFVPDTDDTIAVLNAAEGISGSFSNVLTGQRLNTIEGLGSFLVHYGQQSAFSANQIVLTSFELTGLPSDYNQDGIVNAGDYAVWRDKLDAHAGTLPNDTDGGPIGQAQYETWRANFGATVAAGGAPALLATGEPPVSTPVPEPRAAGLICCGLFILAAGRRSLIAVD